jgi:hypothetical protein
VFDTATFRGTAVFDGTTFQDAVEFVGATFTSDAMFGMAHRLAVLRSVTSTPAATWLLWPYQGELTWRRRRLSDGPSCRCRASRCPGPGIRDGCRLAIAGTLMLPEVSSAALLPLWLAERFRVRP